MRGVRVQRECRQEVPLQPQARRARRRLQQSGDAGRSFTAWLW